MKSIRVNEYDQPTSLLPKMLDYTDLGSTFRYYINVKFHESELLTNRGL